MKRSTLIRFLFPFLALTGIAATARADIVREQVEHYDLSDIQKVVFEISGGNIELSGSDRADLEVDLDLRFNTNSESTADELEQEIEPAVSRKDGTLVIKYDYNRGSSGFWKSIFSGGKPVQINAEIELPKHIRVEVQTSGGNIDVAQIDAPSKLRTSGGNIRARDLHGDTDVHTSGGNIRISDFAGAAKLHTSGGNISISGAVSELDAHTSGGSIEATFDDGITNDTNLDTNGGNITARLPREQGFELLAKTSGGRVNFEHSGTLHGKVKDNKIEASVNGGGPNLTASTSGGSINIATL